MYFKFEEDFKEFFIKKLEDSVNASIKNSWRVDEKNWLENILMTLW